MLATTRLQPTAKSVAQAECFSADWLATLDKAFDSSDWPTGIRIDKDRAYANARYHGGVRHLAHGSYKLAREHLWQALRRGRSLPRRQRAVRDLLLLESLLGVRWLVPRTYKARLRGQADQDAPSVAWPTDTIEDS